MGRVRPCMVLLMVLSVWSLTCMFWVFMNAGSEMTNAHSPAEDSNAIQLYLINFNDYWRDHGDWFSPMHYRISRFLFPTNATYGGHIPDDALFKEIDAAESESRSIIDAGGLIGNLNEGALLSRAERRRLFPESTRKARAAHRRKVRLEGSSAGATTDGQGGFSWSEDGKMPVELRDSSRDETTTMTGEDVVARELQRLERVEMRRKERLEKMEKDSAAGGSEDKSGNNKGVREGEGVGGQIEKKSEGGQTSKQLPEEKKKSEVPDEEEMIEEKKGKVKKKSEGGKTSKQLPEEKKKSEAPDEEQMRDEEMREWEAGKHAPSLQYAGPWNNDVMPERVVNSMDDVDFTMVTHASMARLLNVPLLAARWPGPIIVTVFVSTAEEEAIMDHVYELGLDGAEAMAAAAAAKASKEKSKSTKSSTTSTTTTSTKSSWPDPWTKVNGGRKLRWGSTDTPQPRPGFPLVGSVDEMGEFPSTVPWKSFPNLTLMLYQGTADEVNNYPVNTLRNIALDAVTTSHFLFNDIDFLPDAYLYSNLMARPLKELKDKNLAIVVPAFERKDAGCNNWQCALPATFLQLVDCAIEEKCQPFQMDINPTGHSSTDYNSWWEMQDDLVPVQCVQSARYEPYVALRSSNMVPYFQDVFTGYGKNKIQYLLHLRFLGFDFHLLPESFLIHKPHTQSASKKVWNSKGDHAQNMDNVFKLFFAAIQDAPMKPLVHLCSNKNVK